jgi:hypothetical protein
MDSLLNSRQTGDIRYQLATDRLYINPQPRYYLLTLSDQ